MFNNCLIYVKLNQLAILQLLDGGVKMTYDYSFELPQAGLEDFVGEFHADRVIEMSDLKLSIDELNFTSICDIAHRWKGFCRPYGFLELERLSILLEKEAKSGNGENLNGIFDQIVFYLDEKGKYLTESL